MSDSQELQEALLDSFFDEVGFMKKASPDLTASILPRSPDEVEGPGKSSEFYREMRDYLSGLGYQVKIDRGVASPEKADLIVAHSTASPRLLDAPAGSKTVAVGMKVPDSQVGAGAGKIDMVVVNSKDTPPRMGQESFSPSDEHYVFTKKMKRELRDVAKEQGAVKPWAERATSWMRNRLGFLFEE